jgi:outer membrane lipoprotein-sorting protein
VSKGVCEYRYVGVWAVAIVALALVIIAPVDARTPTAKQILDRAAKHYDAVKDYTTNVKVTVESPSINVPEMNAKVYFKQPDKLHVESKDGFALLPRQGVLLGNPLREIMSGTELSLHGSERVLDHDCYVLKSITRREGRTSESTVWIDKKEWLVRQIQTNPEWGPSAKVKLWYTRVDRKHWMPLTTVAQIALPPLRPTASQEGASASRPTIVTIRFSGYRVNTGLSDKIFEKN